MGGITLGVTDVLASSSHFSSLPAKDRNRERGIKVNVKAAVRKEQMWLTVGVRLHLMKSTRTSCGSGVES